MEKCLSKLHQNKNYIFQHTTNLNDNSEKCHFYGKTTNPAIPCFACWTCTNNQNKYLLKITGDWTKDAGSQSIWDPKEPLGLLTYEENICSYTLSVHNLKKNHEYFWKVDNHIILFIDQKFINKLIMKLIMKKGKY